MDDGSLSDRERVALELVEALGGKASFDLIETMIRAQFRRRLRTTLMVLTARRFLIRHTPELYELTMQGRAAITAPGRQESTP